MTATGRHCPGCRGYTQGWQDICPGIEAGGGATGIRIHHHLDGMSWRNRIRALLGWPVCVEIAISLERVTAADVTDLLAGGLGPDDLTSPGGPWGDPA